MPAARKLDLFKTHKNEYVLAKEPVLVEVGRAQYLAITGRGEPGGERFQVCVGALYGAAYCLKMTSKFAGRDYKVCPLEGLWWGDREGTPFCDVPRDQWNWKLLIRTPDFIGAEQLDTAVAVLLDKNKGPEVQRVRLETIEEGRCVQMLHVGSYATEPETLDRMLAFARNGGLSFGGRHHEIYLSDPRRIAPERLRTLLRHPVVRASGVKKLS